MARHNVIYVKTWCTRDNPLGKVAPGTPNRANGIVCVVTLPIARRTGGLAGSSAIHEHVHEGLFSPRASRSCIALEPANPPVLQATYRRPTFNISEAWRHITASFDAILSSLLSAIDKDTSL